ncbi:MAG: hypothetical protein V4628_11640 [Pseudomonadota bacterium]
MQVDDKNFIVNSLPSLVAFCAFVNKLIGEHKYITFSWRIGQDRSLDQNSLFHVWLTEMAAFYLKKDKRAVIEEELEGMKKMAKRNYYLETGYNWLVIRPVDPKTGAIGQLAFRSSKKYAHGEMFQFLTWLQMTAANDGLVLESKGQFNKLQREAA